MQRQQTQVQLTKGPLLTSQGHLAQAGYSHSLAKQYKRSAITAPGHRIKQWDYYYVGNNQYGVAMTIADLSYSSLYSVTVLDFKHKREISRSEMGFLTFGKVGLCETSEDGNITHQEKGWRITFNNCKGERQLIAHFDNFKDNLPFDCNVTLKQINKDSMAIAIPFQQPGYFYYNHKINLLQAKGKFSLGNLSYDFCEKCYGCLDWGRGVWTYKNTWYWSSVSGEYDGHLIGLNLGYGFGDTSKATQNVFYYDQQAFKLEDVQFKIPKNSKGQQQYLEPWLLVAKGNRVSIEFSPIIDRSANFNYLLISSNQHQVFGLFSGEVRVGDKVYRFENVMGFAQKVANCW